MIEEFLPVCREDMDERGWAQLDFCLSAAMPMWTILPLRRL